MRLQGQRELVMHVADVCGAITGELTRNAFGDLGEGAGSEEEQREAGDIMAEALNIFIPGAQRIGDQDGRGQAYDK